MNLSNRKPFAWLDPSKDDLNYASKEQKRTLTVIGLIVILALPVTAWLYANDYLSLAWPGLNK